MLKSFSLLSVAALVAVLVAGCAGPEKKFGRGVNNIYEPVRLAEMRRSIEQNALSDTGDINYHTGVAHGFSKTLARTGVGIYELITFPFPPYDPVFTDYLAPNPQYPDAYKPGLFEDPVFATDSTIGFSRGEAAPFLPGSKFHVFD